MRDIDGVVTQVRTRRVPNMHALTSRGANEGEPGETQQPATEQPLLTRLNETHLAELIEHHIDYVDGTGKSVHLAASFAKHLHTRDDDALPIVTAIATLPVGAAERSHSGGAWPGPPARHRIPSAAGRDGASSGAGGMHP